MFGAAVRATRVVAMLVREQDAIERGRIETGSFQPQGDLLGAQAGINKKGGVIRGHNGAVP